VVSVCECFIFTKATYITFIYLLQAITFSHTLTYNINAIVTTSSNKRHTKSVCEFFVFVSYLFYFLQSEFISNRSADTDNNYEQLINEWMKINQNDGYESVIDSNIILLNDMFDTHMFIGDSCKRENQMTTTPVKTTGSDRKTRVCFFF
jgi:hypothetical protein